MLQEAFLHEIEAILGSDALPAFISALDAPYSAALRLNPLRENAFSASETFLDAPVPWAEHGYYIREGTRPGKSLAHELGAFYMQEASAMTSAAVMDAKPGEKILDLCAAPGGKSSQLGAALMGEGLLVSNEIVPSRAKILAENMTRLGIANCVAVNMSPDRLAERWQDVFDGVLVDAPCSGEGMFRREPAARDEWEPGSPAGCARRQAEILDSAAKMVRPGGRLVYSTCTFNRMENEGTITAFLERHPEFLPEDFELPVLGHSVRGMLRVWPHIVNGDGHFVAKLRKAEGESRKMREKAKKSGRPKPKTATKTVSEETEEQLLARVNREFCATGKGIPVRYGDYLHLLPLGTPDLTGIKVVKPGLSLAKIGRSHVQPMRELAQSCREGSNTPRALRTYVIDEATAWRALEGERIDLPEGTEKGWILLVTKEGFPVTFRKHS